MHLKNNAHANVAVLQPATRDGRPLRLLPTRAIAAGLLLSIAAPVTAQSSQSTCAPAKQAADVETVQGLEREWLAAEYRGDTGFLDCLLSPDYQVIQARKKTIKSKADLLAVVARKQGSTAKPPQLDTIVSISGARAMGLIC